MMHLPLGLSQAQGCEDEKAYLVHGADRLTDILTRQASPSQKRTRAICLSKGSQENNIVLIELMKDGLPGGLKYLYRLRFRRASEYTQKIRSILWGDDMGQFYVRPSLQGSDLLYHSIWRKTNRDYIAGRLA